MTEPLASHQAGPAPKCDLPQSLVAVRTTGSRPPLFMLHGLSGMAYVNPAFASSLGDDQPIYSFQAPGFEDDRRRPVRRVERLAAVYLDAMRHVQPRGPHWIGALCLGTTVGVEMARRLIADGDPPAPLLILDPTKPPMCTRQRFRKYLQLWAATVLPRGLDWYGRRQRARVIDRMRENGRGGNQWTRFELPPAARPPESSIRAMLSTRMAFQRYRPRPLHHPAFVFVGPPRETTVWRQLLPDADFRVVGDNHGQIIGLTDPLVRAQLDSVLAATLAAIGDRLLESAPDWHPGICRTRRHRPLIPAGC